MKRRVIMCLLTVLSVAVAGFPLQVQAQNTGYTIQNVEVSASADTGTTARMNALAQAESEAFARLLEQYLAPDEAAARAAKTKDYEISRMVRGYEVQNEKVTGNSYSATLDVAFDPTQVQTFLRAPAVPAMASVPTGAAPVTANTGYVGRQPTRPISAQPAPIETNTLTSQLAKMHSNVLVLPVLTAAGNSMLWEDRNVWRNVWNRAEREDNRFIRLAIGDQSDSLMMSAPQATSAEYAAFSPLAERYQAATVVVAEAFPTVSDGVNALGVRLRSLDVQGQNDVIELSYEQGSEETQDDLMLRAAEDIIARIMRDGQARSVGQLEANAPRSKITVLSRLNKLNDWVILRKRLMDMPNVEKIELSAISSQQADMVVHFRGNPMQLEANMTSQGLKVSKAYNYWVVGL
ncbi:MAG: DUF2066 domain-containing protein [Alphaproteobacteria bacterium]|nr:DUF2066 domain-containing protein [Alphaproteobacteria bacterium]